MRALLERVFAIIEEMPPDMQDVLVLSAFCDDSHAEIAARLGISKNAAKMRLVRARQMLRKRVGCIDDHVGVGPLFWARKVAAFRLPAIRFLWSTSHLLPPILIWLVAMPQLEPTPPMLAENVVASSTEKSSLYVPDNRHAVDMGMTNSSIVRPVDPMTPRMHNAAGVHASDKPRPSTQTRRTFDVALPSVPTLMNDRR